MDIDVEPTAQVISEAANRLRQSAVDLDRMALSMRLNKDLSYAAEALMVIMNAVHNARIDLLVTRPIRALSK